MSESGICLQDVLQAKEARQEKQALYRARYRMPLVSISTCMPGKIKDSIDTRMLVQYALQQLLALPGVHVSEIIFLKTGPEALIAIQMNADELKGICVGVENGQPFGRLLDIDVIDADGLILSRRDSGHHRQCFVCQSDAFVCMRQRKHTLGQVHTAVEGLMEQFHAYRTHCLAPMAVDMSQHALQAAWLRSSNSAAASSPATGSAALAHALARCAQAGINHMGGLDQLYPVLRWVEFGEDLQSTSLFYLGVVLSAAGWLVRAEKTVSGQRIAWGMQQMLSTLTAEELLAQPGRDILMEIQNGIPVVVDRVLPILRQADRIGMCQPDMLAQAMAAMIQYNRDIAADMLAMAWLILSLENMNTREQL